MRKVLVTCVDFGFTEPAGLCEWLGFDRALLELQNAPLIATGCLNPGQVFHPKYYEFRGAGKTSIAVGSANLSERALTSNHEVLSVHEGSLKLRSAVQPLVGRADEILQRVPREVAILVVDPP